MPDFGTESCLLDNRNLQAPAKRFAERWTNIVCCNSCVFPARKDVEPHTLLECSSWTAHFIASFRVGQQPVPTYLGFDKLSLTIDNLAAQRPQGWRSPLDFPFPSMLRSPFPFRVRSGCALTTSVLVVLTPRQQGYEKRNGAQCVCLLSQLHLSFFTDSTQRAKLYLCAVH
jgi:hypothetical protein